MATDVLPAPANDRQAMEHSRHGAGSIARRSRENIHSPSIYWHLARLSE